MSDVYEFKPLSEVETQEEPTEATTILAVDSGAVKQIPAGKFGGGVGGFMIRAELNAETGEITSADKSFDEIMAAIEADAFPVLMLAIPVDGGPQIALAPAVMTVPGQGIAFTATIQEGNHSNIICMTDNTWMLMSGE